MVDVKKYALVDLHLHLDGSISLESAKALAKMQGIGLPPDAELLKKLRVESDCRDLNEYLEKFAFPLSLLQSEEAISEAVFRLCEELLAEGLIYAEIRFAPQLHTSLGLTQEQVVLAAIEGQRKSRFSSELILCCMRGEDNYKENIETVRLAKDFLGKGVCAVDLAGAEALFPNEKFTEIFEYARELGVGFTIHAGEAASAQSVRSAIGLGALRIGHGVRSFEDFALLNELAQKKITLELCPTSNLNTKVFDSLSEYPIRNFIDAGVRVTVNTDNRTVSNTTLAYELEKLCEVFDFDEATLEKIVKNAIEASFTDEITKKKHLFELEERLKG